jgi:hypothetical protein
MITLESGVMLYSKKLAYSINKIPIPRNERKQTGPYITSLRISSCVVLRFSRFTSLHLEFLYVSFFASPASLHYILSFFVRRSLLLSHPRVLRESEFSPHACMPCASLCKFEFSLVRACLCK